MTAFEICTAQYRYAGADRLDITASQVYKQMRAGKEWNECGEGRLFAPPSWMPAAHKRRKIDDDEYVDTYLKLMRERYAALSAEYHALIMSRIERGSPRIVLVCFCPIGAFCHRHLASEYLYKIACSIPALHGVVTFMRGDELIIPRRNAFDDPTPEYEQEELL
jgi:hypothetical protein